MPVEFGEQGCVLYLQGSYIGLQQPTVCKLTGLVAVLQRTPGMAGLSKYWDSELTHTVVRSLTRVWQPDQSSVSLLSWYAVLLWVTETSTASLIPNDGWCTKMLPLCLFCLIVFYTISPLVLLFSKQSYMYLCVGHAEVDFRRKDCIK